jgi:hypothetical protein
MLRTANRRRRWPRYNLKEKLMAGYDFNRPMMSIESMDDYEAIDVETANLYGKTVKAVAFANIEYKTRYCRLQDEQSMKSPPSCGRIFPGYLVVRNLGKKNQYETWMPDMAFEEIYQKVT